MCKITKEVNSNGTSYYLAAGRSSQGKAVLAEGGSRMLALTQWYIQLNETQTNEKRNQPC